MSARTVYRDSTEYLAVTVTSDTTLSTQTVELSVDNRATWLAAAWTGTAGTTRSCQVLLNSSNMPPAGERQVFVRIGDTPETPTVAAAGTALFI